MWIVFSCEDIEDESKSRSKIHGMREGVGKFLYEIWVIRLQNRVRNLMGLWNLEKLGYKIGDFGGNVSS